MEHQESSDPHFKKTIEDYTLMENIGTGAYGVVRKAVEKETGLTVAIKCVHKETILKLDKRRHVIREKNILQSMDHPYIIKLLGTAQVLLLAIYSNRMTTSYTLYLKAVRMAHYSIL